MPLVFLLWIVAIFLLVYSTNNLWSCAISTRSSFILQSLLNFSRAFCQAHRLRQRRRAFGPSRPHDGRPNWYRILRNWRRLRNWRILRERASVRFSWRRKQLLAFRSILFLCCKLILTTFLAYFTVCRVQSFASLMSIKVGMRTCNCLKAGYR